MYGLKNGLQSALQSVKLEPSCPLSFNNTKLDGLYYFEIQIKCFAGCNISNTIC